MKKFLGVVLSLIMVVSFGIMLSACGKNESVISISATESEIELILGTEDEKKSVEYTVDNYGSGSSQLNFSLEENEKEIVSFESTNLGNGKTRLTITGLKRGTANIVATSLQGSQKYILRVKVIQPITGLTQKTEFENKLYVISGGELDLSQEEIWNFAPIDTNQRDLDFSIVGTFTDCEIKDGKLIVDESCTLTNLTIKAVSKYNEEISTEVNVKILKPIKVTMKIDDKTVVSEITSASTQTLNFTEIFPKELDGSEYSNSKEITLFVQAGDETDKLCVEKFFGSGEEKFSVLQTAYSYDSLTKLHIYKFLLQSNSNDAGKIDSVRFDFSYEGYNAGKSNYVSSSIELNINSYNKPLATEVNGETSSVSIDIFEDSINLTNGKIIEFSLTPGQIKTSDNYITIWAEDFSTLSVSLYKMNATRTGYTCLFGYDQTGVAKGSISTNGTRYLTVSAGTKLYAFINEKYELVGNKTTKLFAQASGFCNFTTSGRAFTEINFVINPNAKDIYLAEIVSDTLTKIDSSTIFLEIGKSETKYIAVDPSTFSINENSAIQIANSKIISVGDLRQYATDEYYSYGKFTITGTKVGSTTLTVVLSDGKTKEFNVVVISSLEELTINLEDITYGGKVIESDIVSYKDIVDTHVTVNEADPFVELNKLSIANSGGSGVQLIKTPTPVSAQYYLSYSFADYVLPDDETLRSINLSKIDIDSISFGEESNIINTARLSNLSIIEAKNSGAEGNVLVKILVYAMQANGEYSAEPVGCFYYLINFYIPVKGLSITNGTVEIYSYDTIGDKFVNSNNVNKSIGNFSVDIIPVNEGLTPTFIDNLEIYVNGTNRITNKNFDDNNNFVYLNLKGEIVDNEPSATLKLTRTRENNTYSFKVQALRNSGSFIFAMVVSEVNETKKFTAISRIIVEKAVEISEIEVVNASETDKIIYSNPTVSETASEEVIEEIIENPYEFELIYNVYSDNGKEITNSSLEFELIWEETFNGKDYYINSVGKEVKFVSVDENGVITIMRGDYDYTTSTPTFVQFSGKGKLRIYPTSNYFLSTNGWNGETPIVEIPIVVSDYYTIKTASDFEMIRTYPSATFVLGADVYLNDFVAIPEFSGKLTSDGTKTITTNSSIFEKLTESAVVEKINLIYETGTVVSTTEDSQTYYGALANINEGTIKNVNSTVNISASGVDYVGGIVGLNKGLINSSSVYGNISGKTVGGLVGNNQGVINYSKYQSGSINGTDFVGGLVGISTNGEISLSKAEIVTLSGASEAYIGGFAGKIENTLVYENLFNGKINYKNTKSGGFVGKIIDNEDDESYLISNCYAIIDFVGYAAEDSLLAGQFAYDGEFGEIKTSYVSSNAGFAPIVGGNFEANLTHCLIATTAKNSDESDIDLQTFAFPTNAEDYNEAWNFVSVWDYSETGLPTLRRVEAVSEISEFNLSINENEKWLSSNLDLILFFYEAYGEISEDQLAILSTYNIIDAAVLLNLDKNIENFKIVSSDSSILSVSGTLIKILGTGKVDLTIKALIGSAQKTISIYVINPILSVNLTNSNSNRITDVAKVFRTETNYISISTVKTISLNHETISLKQNALGFNFVVYDSESVEISSSFGFNGLVAGADSTLFAEGTISVNPSVLEGEYDFVLQTLLQTENQSYAWNNAQINLINEILKANITKDYKFNVLSKAQRILVSLDNAEIDPSTILSIDVQLQSTKTDDEILLVIYDGEDIIWVSKDTVINGAEYLSSNNSNLFDISGVSGVNAKISIRISEDQRKTITKTKTYKFVVSDSDNAISENFNLVVKPQEILSVTYVHNNRTDDSSETGLKIQDEPSSVMLPGDCGLLTIGLYPVYGNYSKIVVTSEIINENYYVLFEQMYKSSGSFYLPVSSTTGYSSVRDENVLTITKPEDASLHTGEIYVRTKILESVSEGLYFPINITIYNEDENGNEYVVKSETITLLSEVIDSAKITIEGAKDATVARGNTYEIQVSVNENQSLANYALVDAELNSTTNDYVSIVFDTNEFEVVDGRKVYTGTLTVGLDAEIKGDGILKVQTVVSKLINGRLENATDSIEIRIVDFIIEGVKIVGNVDGDNVFDTPSAIEKELKFEFVFSNIPEIYSTSQAESIKRIKAAKEEFLNSLALKQVYSNGSYIYQYTINTDRTFSVNSDTSTSDYYSHISLKQQSVAYDLLYSSDSTPYINVLTGSVQENQYFAAKYNGDKNGNIMDATTLKIVGKNVGSVNMILKISYRIPGTEVDEYIVYPFVINVQMYSDEDKPTPIENAEQFVKYLTSTSSQYATTNFILTNDIELENFTPFTSTNFASLDGNNKVITIKNFAITASSSYVELGLFVNILENVTVKNLTVNYGQLENIVLSQDVSSVSFGGLAVNNNGIIYNCEVVSLDLISNNPSYTAGVKIYFGDETSLKSDDTESEIAGFVVENSSTGSITNSRVGGKGNFKKVLYNDSTQSNVEVLYKFGQFNIIGQGDIAGFVATNNGSIASSYFANGSIVNKTSSGALNSTAGFAITNSYGASIFGSYSEGVKLSTDLSVNITGGGIVAQGISAGFVYSNAGDIADCYSNIRLAGENTGRIVSGFVYSNEKTATVARCYSASTIVGELTTQMPFTGKNAREEIMEVSTSGLVNCYYLVKTLDTESVLEDKYNTGAVAIRISTLKSSSMYGFAMTSETSNVDGVWKWDGSLQQLVSANQIAISVRRTIKNYSSLISSGISTESIDIFPYLSGYEYGSEINPIIIRTADEYNRVFGQETSLTKGVYYAISQMYNKDLGIVFGSYRLVSSIDFDELTNVENVKISSSKMELAKSGSNTGSFDGNALEILNVEISLDNQYSVGLFSRITSEGVFKNASLTVKSISTGQKGVYTGAVAGYVANSSLVNITVSPVTSTGDSRSKITGQNIVGGVAGAVVGNSKLSNLVSSISVVSGNKSNSNFDINNYILEVLRNSSVVENGVITDKNKGYSFAGGVIGILDIYEDINDDVVVSSEANAKQLVFKGNDVSVQGAIVGGVVAYCGASTYLVDSAFVLEGKVESLGQRLISYGNTIGGVVGVNQGELYELRIEHEDSIQTIIENNIQNYYNNANSVFRGNEKLFNSTTSELKYIGGLVGQMLEGELTVSYAKVDVNFSGAEYAGGIFGLVKTKLDLIEVYAFGDVDGKIAGGFIGKQESSVSFDRCVAINFISKTNSSLIDIDIVAIANANLTLQEPVTALDSDSGKEYTTYSTIYNEKPYSNTLEKSAERKTVVISVEINGKIYNVKFNIETKKPILELENYKGMIGECGNYEYTVVEETYSNKTLTYNGITVSIDFGGKQKSESSLAEVNILGLTIDGGLSSYHGYATDASVVNKMFLGADWDANLWELKDERIFPSFCYGIVEKTYYIEKPLDIIKLKKYYKADNVIIFGDDPTTSFNPYEYNKDDTSTWGTFTAEELIGLSRDGESLKFDISVIQNYLSIEDSYFKRFLGTMYGEYSVRKDVKGTVWTYTITNISYPIFDYISGGSISGLQFSNADSSATITGGVLANKAVNDVDLENLSFTNIVIGKAKDGCAGIIASQIENVYTLKNIKISDCEITLNEQNVNAGAIAGKLTISSSFSSRDLNIPSSVIVNKFTVSESASTGTETNLGGLVGKTDINTKLIVQAVLTNTTITSETTNTVLCAGGFVGKASGATECLAGTTNVNISFANENKNFIGLGFGRVENALEQTMQNGEPKTYTGFVTDNTATEKSSILEYGAVAGYASSVVLSGVKTTIEKTKTDSTKTYELNFKTKDETTSATAYSSIGGLVGEVAGTAEISNINNVKTDKTQTTINVTDSSTGIVYVGGIAGKIGGKVTIGDEKTIEGVEITIEGAETNDKLIISSSANIYVGGLVGANTSGIEDLTSQEKKFDEILNSTFSGEIEATTTKDVYVAGFVGCSIAPTGKTNELHIEDSTSSGKITVKGAANAIIGGFVGVGQKLTLGKVSGTTYSNGNYFSRGIEISSDFTSIIVGGIVGSASNECKIYDNKVGGDINFISETITGSITAGGIIGSSSNASSEFSSNYAWGNITLKNAMLLDGDAFAITSITAGGIVGTVENKPILKNNYSLTSMYITKQAKQAKQGETHNVNAVVGIGEVKADSSNNKYCHQINLATDTVGTNCYYKAKKGNENPILDDLVGSGKPLESCKGTVGTKLNPQEYDKAADTEVYAYMISDVKSTGPRKVSGHLVGDGYTITSIGTPFSSISGAVSGVKFNTTSDEEGIAPGGKVREEEYKKGDLPNGVVGENSGIIFAVVVNCYGYVTPNVAGKVRYSFNAGVAQYNGGLIADTGVNFNVKSLYAGIASINNELSTDGKTQGLVKNAYTTGAVHEGAYYGLVDTNTGTRGAVLNSYVAIKCDNLVYQNPDSTKYPLLETFYSGIFYDTYATEKTGMACGTAKNTDYMSTTNSSTTSILTDSTNGKLSGSNWAQDYSINYGYPYFGAGAYSGFGYLMQGTGTGSSEKWEVTGGSTDSTTKNGCYIAVTYSNTTSSKTGLITRYTRTTEWNINGYTFKVVYKELIGTNEITFNNETNKRNSLTKNIDFDGFRVKFEVSNYDEYTITVYSDIEIPNPGKLKQIEKGLDKSYTLMANINAGALGSWIPISDFTGTLNGNEYVIENIPSISTTANHAGFIKKLNGGTVKNCGFVYVRGVYVYSTGDNDAGGVVGLMEGGTIENVFSSGATVKRSESGNSAGGLVGAIIGGTISNCQNYNTVYSRNDTGGIVAYAREKYTIVIEDCTNYGRVANWGGTSDGKVAGIVASVCEKFNDEIGGTISVRNCRNYGQIGDSDSTYAGGIVAVQHTGSISYCQNYGNVSATTNAGGIVGRIDTERSSIDDYSYSAQLGRWDGKTGKGTHNGSAGYSEEVNLTDTNGTTEITLKFWLSKITVTFKYSNVQNKEFVFENSDGSDTYDPYSGIVLTTDEYVYYFTFEAYSKGTIKQNYNGYFQSSGEWGYKDFYLYKYEIDCLEINWCFNSGNISATKSGSNNDGSFAGGIVGRMLSYEEINFCQNAGIIVAKCFAGGIVGGTYSGGGSNVGYIYSSIHKGSVLASDNGCWTAHIGNDVATIENCPNAGFRNGGNTKNDQRNGSGSSSSFAEKSEQLWSSHTTYISPKEGTTTYNVYTAEQYTYVVKNCNNITTELNVMNDLDFSLYSWDLSNFSGKENLNGYLLFGKTTPTEHSQPAGYITSLGVSMNGKTGYTYQVEIPVWTKDAIKATLDTGSLPATYCGTYRDYVINYDGSLYLIEESADGKIDPDKYYRYIAGLSTETDQDYSGYFYIGALGGDGIYYTCTKHNDECPDFYYEIHIKNGVVTKCYLYKHNGVGV